MEYTNTLSGRNTRGRDGQGLPNNLDAERAVLGSILIDAEALPAARALLAVSDFYSSPHQRVFQAMLRLADAGTPIDLTTLNEELRKCGHAEEVGGLAYLSSLEQYVMMTANVGHHAAIVKEHSRRHTLLIALHGMAERPANGEEASTILSEIVRLSQTTVERRGRVYSAGEYLARRDSYAEPRSIWYDGVLNGGTVNILAATTGLGKTFCGLQLAVSVAGGMNFLGQPTTPGRVLFVQAEIADAMLIERLDVMLEHLLANMDSDTATGIRDAIAERLFIRDLSSGFHLWAGGENDPTLAHLYLAELRSTVKTIRPDMVILDPYSKIFRVTGPWEIRTVLEAVDVLAEEFGLCVLIVARWNKASRRVSDVNLEQAISGGAALVDDASAVLNLSYLPRTPVTESQAKLTFDKCRYCERPESIILRRPCREARMFVVDPNIPADGPTGRPRKGEAELIAVRCGIHVFWCSNATGAARQLEGLVRQFVRGVEKDFRRLAAMRPQSAAGIDPVGAEQLCSESIR